MLREWTRRCGGVSRGTAFRTPPRCRHPHGGVASSALGDQALHGRTFVVPILAGATRWPAHGAVARDAAPQRGIAAAVRGDWCGLPRDSGAAAVAVLLGVPGLFFLAQGRSLTRPRRNVPRGLGDRSDESRASYVLLSDAYGRIAGAWCGVYLRWSSRAVADRSTRVDVRTTSRTGHRASRIRDDQARSGDSVGVQSRPRRRRRGVTARWSRHCGMLSRNARRRRGAGRGASQKAIHVSASRPIIS